MAVLTFGPNQIADLMAALDEDAPKTIELLPGTYAVRPIIVNASITVVGKEGPAETILHPADDPQEIFAIYGGEGETVLRGLTLRGGAAPGGGALIVDGTSRAAVEDCIFEGNRAGAIGGGAVHVGARSALSLTRCIFRGNQADLGGAIALTFQGRASIDRCVFTDNEADLGGAIAARERTQVTIASSTFVDNRARRSDGGGTVFVTGMKTRGPVVELVNCLVVGDRPFMHDPSRRGTVHLASSVLPPDSVAPALASSTGGLLEVQADLVDVGGATLGTGLFALRAGAAGTASADLSRVTKNASDLLGRPLVREGRADPGALAAVASSPDEVPRFDSIDG